MCIMHLGTKSNFVKLTPNLVEDLGVGYDYSSIMHYSAYAFAIDYQKKTIVPKVSNHHFHRHFLFVNLLLVALLTGQK